MEAIEAVLEFFIVPVTPSKCISPARGHGKALRGKRTVFPIVNAPRGSGLQARHQKLASFEGTPAMPKKDVALKKTEEAA